MTDLEKKTVKYLQNECRRLNIERFSRLKKQQLCQLVGRHRAARRIQRWWLRRRKTVNITDPITLERIPSDRLFYLVQNDPQEDAKSETTCQNKLQHCRYQFDCVSLLQYHLSTLKFENPFTREPLAEVEINRLLAQNKRLDEIVDVVFHKKKWLERDSLRNRMEEQESIIIYIRNFIIEKWLESCEIIKGACDWDTSGAFSLLLLKNMHSDLVDHVSHLLEVLVTHYPDCLVQFVSDTIREGQLRNNPDFLKIWFRLIFSGNPNFFEVLEGENLIGSAIFT